MQRLRDKVVIITGAAGGQGAAEARLFAEHGACLVLTDVDTAGLTRLTDEIKERGGRAASIVHDVASESQWQSVTELASSAFGAVHALVNNAGTISRHGIGNIPLASWDRTIAVNLTGAMLGMKLIAPQIRNSGGGAIVNVSSTAGMTAHYDAAYCASKWGLRGLSKMAAAEFANWNIRVNSIHPGVIEETGFIRDGQPGHAAAALATVPMARQGTPQECANLVLFLVSDEASFITGAEVAIDGGYTAGGLIAVRNKLRETLAPRS